MLGLRQEDAKDLTNARISYINQSHPVEDKRSYSNLVLFYDMLQTE